MAHKAPLVVDPSQTCPLTPLAANPGAFHYDTSSKPTSAAMASSQTKSPPLLHMFLTDLPRSRLPPMNVKSHHKPFIEMSSHCMIVHSCSKIGKSRPKCSLKLGYRPSPSSPPATDPLHCNGHECPPDAVGWFYACLARCAQGPHCLPPLTGVALPIRHRHRNGHVNGNGNGYDGHHHHHHPGIVRGTPQELPMQTRQRCLPSLCMCSKSQGTSSPCVRWRTHSRALGRTR